MQIRTCQTCHLIKVAQITDNLKFNCSPTLETFYSRHTVKIALFLIPEWDFTEWLSKMDSIIVKLGIFFETAVCMSTLSSYVDLGSEFMEIVK